jgi:nucleotide-binding universal stress UspA family protein
MSAPLRILLPVDGSEPSARATAHVLDLAARGLAVDVHLLNVQPAVRGVVSSLVPHAEVEDYHRDEGMKALAACRALASAAGVATHCHVGVGEPGPTVIAFLASLGCDQVVMGTRGLGAVGGLVLGSVAQHVVAHSDVPVTLRR